MTYFGKPELTGSSLTWDGTKYKFGTGGTLIAGELISSGNISSVFSSGDEGGEINLARAVTNNTLSGSSVNIDVYQNKLRIFESGGSNRGGYFDITKLGAGVSTRLDGSSLDYSIVDVLYYGNTNPGAQNLTIDITDTNYTIGNKFYVTRSSKSVIGVRFAAAVTASFQYSASLWNNAGTLLSSKVITCSSGSFIYEAIFDSPVSITDNLIHQDLTVGLYQLAALNYSYIGVGNFQNGFPTLPFVCNGFAWKEFSLFSAGNTKPAGSAASERYPVEPIIVG